MLQFVFPKSDVYMNACDSLGQGSLPETKDLSIIHNYVVTEDMYYYCRHQELMRAEDQQSIIIIGVS